jgi:hypothetical protein
MKYNLPNRYTSSMKEKSTNSNLKQHSEVCGKSLYQVHPEKGN